VKSCTIRKGPKKIHVLRLLLPCRWEEGARSLQAKTAVLVLQSSLLKTYSCIVQFLLQVARAAIWSSDFVKYTESSASEFMCPKCIGKPSHRWLTWQKRLLCRRNAGNFKSTGCWGSYKSEKKKGPLERFRPSPQTTSSSGVGRVQSHEAEGPRTSTAH